MTNTEAPHTQVNLDTFCETLADQYRTLFASDPDYAHVASQLTPEALARKMTLGARQRDREQRRQGDS